MAKRQRSSVLYPGTPTKKRKMTHKSAMKEFHLFPQLPVELQLIIWELASVDNEPRVVEVSLNDESENSSVVPRAYCSVGNPPAMLHASSTSRMVCLKSYEQLNIGGNFTGSYIRWNLDAVFIDEPLARGLFDPAQPKGVNSPTYYDLAQQCRRFVVPASPHGFHIVNAIVSAPVAEVFPHLDHIVLLRDREINGRGDKIIKRLVKPKAMKNLPFIPFIHKHCVRLLARHGRVKCHIMSPVWVRRDAE